MFKIDGLDKLTKQLTQAQLAIEELDGEIETVKFDPNDPASIESAIHQTNTTLDAKIATWADNPLVVQLVDGMKEQFREAIIERAAAARLERGEQ
ncbi:hypothetical protein CPBF426_28110 [Xanthomonas arboricola pv. juglandis]|uniref:hypothetical protein n=1 Tax=Xanthomonas TaxID=338 RepID=UPI000E5AD739|nr:MULTISPECIES: hypothetical protein [Xanthomonas]MCS3809290.1 hypothetical protein [Xanthomonas sp. 4461]CAD1789041.1 hypothetical protein XSP_001151 [Xanthomonas sp. CPBF 426]CAG2086327.1 hypothetical protein XCY_001117 [Xanthomonas euroxanthea]SYZ54671.1 hypothetical protein CPBF426_28110 [Xanthomonas arboricola pv. juglandis]